MLFEGILQGVIQVLQAVVSCVIALLQMSGSLQAQTALWFGVTGPL